MNINASFTNAIYSDVALNPQPLPPKPTPFSSSLWNSAINPQPLPPGRADSFSGASLWNSAFNQQTASSAFTPSNGSEQKGIIIVGGRQVSLDDYCGNGYVTPHIPHIGPQFNSES